MHVLIYIVSNLFLLLGFITAFFYVLRSNRIIIGIGIGWGLTIIGTFISALLFPAVTLSFSNEYYLFFPDAIGILPIILLGWIPISVVSIAAATIRYVALRVYPNIRQSKIIVSMTGFRVFAFIGLFYFSSGVLLLGVLYIFAPNPRDFLPDLSSCTRIEIRYPGSALNYFFPNKDLQNLLSDKEKSLVQSFKTFEVTDKDTIRIFAQDISMGIPFRLRGMRYDKITMNITDINITYYSGEKKSTSFIVSGFSHEIVTQEKRIFDYPQGMSSLKLMEPPEIRPFELRKDCALNLKRLYALGYSNYRVISVYSEPNKWCDSILKKAHIEDNESLRSFKCPSAGEGRCNYAMNPDCEPNSPSDMVLLFETRDGLNQHGGQELFTFDNHNPKGGCVLLNDGTVKFIRTEAELHALRWK